MLDPSRRLAKCIVWIGSIAAPYRSRVLRCNADVRARGASFAPATPSSVASGLRARERAAQTRRHRNREAARKMAAIVRSGTAERALQGAAASWLAMALLGQWAFFAYLAAFYGPTAASGDFEPWNRLAALGAKPFVRGDTVGNLAFLAHALGAAVVSLGGALQLVPWLRRRAPAFHRWNGRVFLATVVALSLSGFYLVWIRLHGTDRVGAIGTTLNGVLILVFALRTFVTARARDIVSHRRWALRLYLVSNAQWFTRVGVFGYFVLASFVGHRPSSSDWFFPFWTFGCYVVPLVVLELYLRTRERGGRATRFAMAGALVVLTLAMTLGIVAFGGFTRMIVSGAPLALH
jgi:uncharacterized membrane protein